MWQSNSSAQNLAALAHRLVEASAAQQQRLRHGAHVPVPWVYAAWMCMLLLAVCTALRFMVEDIVRSSKAAARRQEEREAALQADAAERGECQGECQGGEEQPQSEAGREFFAVDDAARAIEVVVHWTTSPRASVPTRRSRSGGSLAGSPVTPI